MLIGIDWINKGREASLVGKTLVGKTNGQVRMTEFDDIAGETLHGEIDHVERAGNLIILHFKWLAQITGTRLPSRTFTRTKRTTFEYNASQENYPDPDPKHPTHQRYGNEFYHGYMIRYIPEDVNDPWWVTEDKLR